MDLTQDRLKELLDYEPSTGVFRWKVSRRGCGGKVKPGAPAGHVTGFPGYVHMKVDGLCCKAHRLAFLFMEGYWPKQDVDHINGDKADNRWRNLRECSRSENAANTSAKRFNSSGFKGVSPHGNRWKAQIRAHGVTRYLGLFATPEEASMVYEKAAKAAYGQFTRSH